MRIGRHRTEVGVLAAVTLILFLAPSADGLSHSSSSRTVQAVLEGGAAGGSAKESASLEWDTGFVLGDLWFPYVSNKGFFGLAISTAEYPGGSENSHLWQGGLWMGGDADLTAEEDVRMAIGTFDQLHFFGYDTLGVGFTDISEGCMRAVQTRFNTAFSPRDLGVTVEMTIRGWDQAGYDDFLIIDCLLRFDNDLEDFFFGWMSDYDIGNNVLADFHIDDLAGYDETAGVAYMYDADGDPLHPDDPSGPKVSTTAMGQILLEAPTPGGSVTAPRAKSPSISWAGFNWWDWNSDVTSETDAYERLSSTKKDIALPVSTFDYRIQTGIGPYTTAAGDTARFVLAYVMGDGVAENAGPMGSLLAHAQGLATFYAGGCQIAEVSPPAPMINTPEVSGLTVEVSWSADPEADPAFSHYNLYRSRATAIGPWEFLAELALGTTSYDIELEPGFGQFFLVTSVSQTGRESNWNSAWSKTLQAVEGSVGPATTLADVTVAPNPYVGSADWELSDFEGKILFSNLPARCTLRIYNLAGDLIYDAEHCGEGLGTETWNLLTKDRQSVASGLYLYSVESPGLGQKVGKFAIIKGQR